jgi:hypothetical protein
MRLIAFALILVLFSSGCTNVSEQDVEIVRKALETGNPDYCVKVSEPLGRDLCFSTLASKNRDEKLCARISDTELTDGCYVSVAMMKQDASICNKLSDERTKKECADSVKGMGKEIVANVLS